MAKAGIDRMIPEPDYDPYDNSPANYNNKPYNRRNNNNEMHNTADRLCMGNSILDKDGLAIPRKPANPCVESTERRDLHRELMFNQKIGKPILNQKTELQKALQKHREHKTKAELEQERLSSRSTLEKALEQRARRLEELERAPNDQCQDTDTKSRQNNEFLQMHAKLRGRVEAKKY